MKAMIKSIVATLAVVVGFDAFALGNTFYAELHAESVPSMENGGGGVWTTKSSVSTPKSGDFESENASNNDVWMMSGNSADISFYAYHPDDTATYEFLYWKDSSGNTLSTASFGEWTWCQRKITATSTSENSPTTDRIYGYYHVHNKQYVVNGLTIEYKCVNTETTCKNSCESSSATLTAEDSKVYDGHPYEATVTGDSSATLEYTAKAGSALTGGKAISVGNYTVTMRFGDKTVSKDFEITHAHNPEYSVKDNVISMLCTVPGCEYETTPATATLKAEGMIYTGSAYAGATITKDAGFVGEPEITYYKGETLLAKAPIAAGEYVVKATIGGVTASKAFTIAQKSMADISAAMTTLEFNYTGAEIQNTLGEVLFGGNKLGLDDYESSGVMKSVGSGYSNETYTITLTGKGNFTGTKTITWTIKAPTGEFGEGAFKVNSKLVFNQATQAWETKSTLDWPESSLNKFSKEEHVILKVDDGETVTVKKNISLGEISLGTAESVDAVNWTVGCTPAELDGANGLEVTHTLTACGLAWWKDLAGGLGYGDKNGIRATNFVVTIATKDIALDLPEGNTYDLGSTKLENIKIRLAANAVVTSEVQQTTGKIISGVAGRSIKETFASNVYIYELAEHVHDWAWAVSGDTLTVTCKEEACGYHTTAATLSIGPETEGEWYCNTNKSRLAVLKDAKDFEDATGATIGAIEYFDGEEKLAAAPVQPGEYTAKCEIISADEATTNTISKVLEILTGQAICNGVHVADAKEYLEKETTEPMEISIGKDFTASKTFTVPANKKVTTVEEAGTIIQKYVDEIKELLKDGKYVELFKNLGKFGITKDEAIALFKNETTVENIANRLKKQYEDVIYLDCGTKTLELNGFTVTAPEGSPLIRNEGTLALTGEGTLITNGCETLIANTGTLTIEGGRYAGAITNDGALAISGGYFTGAIANGDNGSVVLTGGAYEIKPDEDFIPAGYDLVKREGIYHVEKHEHNYTFLPLGRCMMSATCWNFFVDDSDQKIQFSNCGAHKLGIFIAARDGGTGVLPKRSFSALNKKVEANIVAYNYSALAKIGILKNISELIDIAEEAVEASEEWDEATEIERLQKMISIMTSISDLKLDLTEVIWDQARIEKETGLKFGKIEYYDDETDELLAEAPSAAGRYRARTVITTPKGNNVTRTWRFSIGQEDETIEEWAQDVADDIKSDWEQFKRDIKEAADRLPTDEEVEQYFKDLDKRVRENVVDLTNKLENVDQKIVDAYEKAIKDLKETYQTVEEWTKKTDQDIREAYEQHCENADQVVIEWHEAITNDFRRFCDELEEKKGELPTKSEIREYLDGLDAKVESFFEEAEQQGRAVDQKIIEGYQRLTNRLRVAELNVEEWTKTTDAKIREAYENHKKNADELVRTWHQAIVDDYRRFCREVEDAIAELPTSEDVKAYFDSLDEKVKEFFRQVKAQGDVVDDDIVEEYERIVKRLRAIGSEIADWSDEKLADVMAKLRETDAAIGKWTKDLDAKIREAYERHCENADALVLSWYEAITNDLRRFCDEVEVKTGDLPTQEEIREFIDKAKATLTSVDQKIKNFRIEGPFFNPFGKTEEETEEQPTEPGHYEIFYKFFRADTELEQFVLRTDFYIRDTLRGIDEQIYTIVTNEADKAQEVNDNVKQFIADHVAVEFENGQTNFVYNGEEQGPKIASVTCGCYELKFGDYEVLGDASAVEGGEYELTVKGHGFFESYEQAFGWKIIQHQWSFTEEGGVLKADCGNKSCPIGGHLELSIAAESKDWDQYPVRPEIVDEGGLFRRHTLAKFGEIRYFRASGEELAEAPAEPGEYKAEAKITIGDDDYTISKKYEIRTVDISNATVYTDPDKDEFVYSETEHAIRIDTVIVNGVLLTEGTDYTNLLASVTAATDVGDYEITIEGIGHYAGTRKVEWAIVAPTREFAEDAFDQITGDIGGQVRKPYGEISGKELAITASTNLYFDVATSNWYAGVTIDWPYDTAQILDEPQYTAPEKAYVTVTAPTYTNRHTAAELIDNAGESIYLTAESGKFYRIRHLQLEEYVKRIGWDIEITIADIEAAKARGESELEYTITVASPANENDPDGLAETSYTIILPFTNLKLLDDNERQLYPKEEETIIVRDDEKGPDNTEKDGPITLINQNNEDEITRAGDLVSTNYNVTIVNETENTLSVGNVSAGGDVIITNMTEAGTISSYGKIEAGNDVIIDNQGHLNAEVNAGGDITIYNGSVHTLVGSYAADGSISLDGADGAALGDVTLSAAKALTMSGTNVITGSVTLEAAAITNMGHVAFSVAGGNHAAHLNDFDQIAEGEANANATFGIWINDAQADGTYVLADNAAGTRGRSLELVGETIATNITVGAETLRIGKKRFTLAVEGTSLKLTVETYSEPPTPTPTPEPEPEPEPEPQPSSIDELEQQLLDRGDVDYDTDASGNVTNVLIVMRDDFEDTLNIPDYLGIVTIDLNGYSIIGDNGVKGCVDGKSAVMVETGSWLKVIGAGMVKGGDGFCGEDAGSGAPAILPGDALIYKGEQVYIVDGTSCSGMGIVTFTTNEVAATEGETFAFGVQGGSIDRSTAVTLTFKKGTYTATPTVYVDGEKAKFPVTLDWARGDVAEKEIMIATKASSKVEADKFFTLQLSGPAGIEMGEIPVMTVTIEDAKTPSESEANYVRAIAWPAYAGTVSGMGGLKNAKSKRTLKAKAKSYATFAGWYLPMTNDVNQIDTNALVTLDKSLKVGSDSQYGAGTYYAYFTDVLPVASVIDPDEDAETAEGVEYAEGVYAFQVGIYTQLPVGLDDYSGKGTLTVSGLPSGLKYSKKTGFIYGTPTRASTGKKFKVIAKNAAGKQTVYYDYVAEALPANAVGTWNGVVRQLEDPDDGTHAGFGTVQFSATSAGKLSAKVTTRIVGTKSFSVTGYELIGENIYGIEMTTKQGEVFSAKLYLTNDWKTAQLVGTVTGGEFAENGEEIKFAAIRNAFDKTNTEALSLLEAYKGTYAANLVTTDGKEAAGKVEFNVQAGGKVYVKVKTASKTYISTCAGAFRALSDGAIAERALPADSAAVQVAIRAGKMLWAMDTVLRNEETAVSPTGLACEYDAVGNDTHSIVTE